VLHSFYNGVENIFQRIASRLDQNFPSSEFWHQELLDQMKRPTQDRERVLSETIYEKLKPYLGFRHFFRHSYAFQFKWEKIKALLLDLTDVFIEFKNEIAGFVDRISQSSDYSNIQ
jgi:hypothetical protein